MIRVRKHHAQSSMRRSKSPAFVGSRRLRRYVRRSFDYECDWAGFTAQSFSYISTAGLKPLHRAGGRPDPSWRYLTLLVGHYQVMTKARNDEVRPLSLGLMKDTTPSSKPWQKAVMVLMLAIKSTRPDKPGPLNLNVVYQIGGSMFQPEFSGVRTGRFRKRDSHLMVQVGIQRPEAEADGGSAREVVRERLFAAIEEAEAWARRRRIADSLDDLRAIAARAVADV